MTGSSISSSVTARSVLEKARSASRRRFTAPVGVMMSSPNSLTMSGMMGDHGESAWRESSSRSMRVAPHSFIVAATVDLPDAMPPAR